MGVSSFFHLLGASHTSLVEPFVRLSIQVTAYLMNALVHFVHWSIPLFLFLVDIPHGKDINHFNLPPFFNTPSDLPSVEIPSPLEYLLSFQFYFLELRIPYCVPPYAFSLVSSQNASPDHPPKFRQIPCATVLIRFLTRCFPTAERLPKLRQSSICPVLGLQTNAYFLGRLFKCFPSLFRQFFKCLPHYGKESSLFVPSFPFLRRLPISAFPLCRIPTTACRFSSATPYLFIGVFSVYFWKKQTFFVSFFLLYLYYSRKLPFVNRFFKNFLLKFKIFFDKRKDGRIIFFRQP